MNFKPLRDGELTPIDVSEWDDNVKAFLKPLGGVEQLVFNDYFLDLYNSGNDLEKRFNAGFSAALMTIVDENGEPLMREEDREQVRRASFAPIFRVFSQCLSQLSAEGDLETAKKN